MTILDKMTDYHDLANLSNESLMTLCQELRETIINVVLKNGGHLGSPLGAVELTVALLRQFDPERDKIVFDVGHQSYTYKILTGRKERFTTLRQWKGMSGFPKRSESKFDHFDVGHSSTSLSASLGFSKARDLRGANHEVIAIIGDGSLLNGMAFEALNYVKEANTKVIFVLNDNEMCISKRVGGFATHLARLSSNYTYKKFKRLVREASSKLPKGETVETFLEKTKNKIKGLVKPDNIFDEMGINYWGPFDGHNIKELESVFRLARKYDKPVLIHIVTKKGKGYRKAEEEPWIYHGVSPDSSKKCNVSWSKAVASTIEKLAAKDQKIVCLTAAMKEGNKLNGFSEKFPDRFFDVGIAEEHMLTMAAGMAAGGIKPCVFIYSTFMQRAMDQLVHDIAMQNLPVIISVDRAGLIGQDGETHQGLLDVAWGRSIPNLHILSPRDQVDLELMYRYALERSGPTLIRYPRGKACESLLRKGPRPTSITMKSKILTSGKEWALIGYGKTMEFLSLTKQMALEQSLPGPTLLDLRILKPLDWQTIDNVLLNHSLVIVAEDGYISGGIGEVLSSRIAEISAKTKFRLFGVPDKFIPHGTTEQQWKYCGMTPEKIIEAYIEHSETEN